MPACRRAPVLYPLSEVYRVRVSVLPQTAQPVAAPLLADDPISEVLQANAMADGTSAPVYDPHTPLPIHHPSSLSS